MPKIKANGVNLHYISVGAGPDVVMLHGFLGNLAVWHLNMYQVMKRFPNWGKICNFLPTVVMGKRNQ